MKKTTGFYPTEIIFSTTTLCNLNCPHCYVSRQNKRIDISKAINFINGCKNTSIEKIGFTGGEPFLYFDFLIEITKACVKNDFLFDQIMTNGDWWQTEEQLNSKLQQLYDAGYDGKIGLSWDNFHGQSQERITTFICAVQKIFGPDSINIQTVKGIEGESDVLFSDTLESKTKLVSEANLPLSPTSSGLTLSNGGQSPVTPPEQNLTKDYISQLFPEVPVYELPQTFQSEDERGWQSKKWFKEDYCQGPGNIFYVHSDGNIAPCCGFSNENSKLFIGTINDSYQQLMENAASNPYIQLCFTKGLSSKIKTVKKQLKQKKSPLAKCKTGDICTFCDYYCKNC